MAPNQSFNTLGRATASRLLMPRGVEGCLISGRSSPLVGKARRQPGIRHLIQAAKDKLNARPELRNHNGRVASNRLPFSVTTCRTCQ